MAHGEKDRAESARCDCSKYRVPVVFRLLEGATRGADPLPARSRPRHQSREVECGPSCKVIPSATLTQVAGHLSESIPSFVVAETGTGDHAHCRVVERCGVAAATLAAW